MKNSNFEGGFRELAEVLCGFPDAAAIIRGDEHHPTLAGIVLFFSTRYGVLVASEIRGLPKRNICESSVFGFHIHEGESCGGENFADSAGHLNPNRCPHPAHAGDMPPIIASHEGYAISVFLSSKIDIESIIGKTVVLHSGADDFKTQPAGNSGEKIACGIIGELKTSV